MLMKGLSLRGLEVFEALADSGSVAQAAEMTGLSQPAVSQQVRNLEDHVGKRLFVRQGNQLLLTDAGREKALQVGSVCYMPGTIAS